MSLRTPTQPERRCAPRGRPEELSYIQFEPGGGGIVLNASEQGLAFHLAAPLRRRGPTPVRVSPNPMQQIKLTAEIAWIDSANKSGGLRFTEFTADAENQIRQWLTKTRQSEAPDGKFVIPSCAPKEETDPCSDAPSGVPGPLPGSPLLDNALPSGADAATLAVARFRSIPAKALLPAPRSQEKHIPIGRPRLLRSFAAGFSLSLLAFTTILLLQNFRLEIGNSLIRLGEKLKGRGDTQAVAPLPAPVHTFEPTPASTPSVPSPIPETEANEIFDHSDPAESTQTTHGGVNSTDSRLADPQNSRQHFADAHLRRDRSALARQLWSAVGAGDNSAEVALAQLYVTGDGVPRNCEQARVLLSAASKNGNIEALQQLRKLKNSACR
jgi:hypothetical protein